MVEFLNNIAKTIYSAGNGNAINPSNLKIQTSALTIANNIWSYLCIIGMGMTIIYFLLEINRRMVIEGGDFNFKSLLGPFVKLALSIAILSKGGEIVGWLISFNNGFVDEASKWQIAQDVGASGTSDEWETSIFEDMSIFQLCLAFLPMLLCWLVSLVVELVYWYKAIAFKIKYLFRIGITPIALADVYSGQNGAAMRWLKGFIGVGLTGVAYIVVPKLAAEIVLSTLVDDDGNSLLTPVVDDLWKFIKSLFLSLLAPIAGLGTLSACEQLAKEVCG